MAARQLAQGAHIAMKDGKMSTKDNVLAARLRGAEWHGIGQKIRDCAMAEQTDINKWCMEQAEVCWARGDEAYAIAKIIETSELNQ